MHGKTRQGKRYGIISYAQAFPHMWITRFFFKNQILIMFQRLNVGMFLSRALLARGARKDQQTREPLAGSASRCRGHEQDVCSKGRLMPQWRQRLTDSRQWK